MMVILLKNLNEIEMMNRYFLLNLNEPDYKQRIVYSGQSPVTTPSNDATQWNIKLEFPNWFISPSDKTNI